MVPRPAAVLRRPPADISAAAVDYAANLESRHDRRAVGERVRLDLGLVLTGRVVEFVGADSNEIHVRRGCVLRSKNKDERCNESRYLAVHGERTPYVCWVDERLRAAAPTSLFFRKTAGPTT